MREVQGGSSEGCLQERNVHHAYLQEHRDADGCPQPAVAEDADECGMNVGAGVQGVEQLGKHKGGKPCGAGHLQRIVAVHNAAGEEEINGG